jgi:hypothetical protein
MTTAFVYKWNEISTGRWYIGSRTALGCHPNDGYICSSKIVRPLIEENPSNWTRQILCIGHPTDMYKLECDYLNTIDAAHDPMSYNQSNGGYNFGNTGKKFPPRSIETRKKLSEARRGKPKTDEHRRKLKESCKGRVSPFKGKHHSDESKQLLAQVDKSYTQTQDYRNNMSKATSGSLNGRYKGPTIATNIETGDQIVLHGAKQMAEYGFSQSAVSMCINGDRKSHRGYTFHRIQKAE